MRLYLIGGKWQSRLRAIESLIRYVYFNGHLCSQITNPSGCCPVAHGAAESECVCIRLDNFKYITVTEAEALDLIGKKRL